MTEEEYLNSPGYKAWNVWRNSDYCHICGADKTCEGYVFLTEQLKEQIIKDAGFDWYNGVRVEDKSPSLYEYVNFCDSCAASAPHCKCGGMPTSYVPGLPTRFYCKNCPLKFLESLEAGTIE